MGTAASVVSIRIEGLRLISPNVRSGMTRGAAMAHHAAVQAIRRDAQLYVARECLRSRGIPRSAHFVRIAPKRMDSDNHIAAWKPARDGMCAALGFDDACLVIAEKREGVQCTFEQRSEGAGHYAVVIELSYDATTTQETR